MTQQPPAVTPVKTKEEREAEEEKIYDKIAEKVAKRLIQPAQKLPYSACRICGYQFIDKEDEDKYNECPNCGNLGETVKLLWSKTEK
jgi:rubrerythrin